MRTLYYNIIIRRENFGNVIQAYDYEYSMSEGFAIINCNEGKINKIEGVLTMDYLVGELEGDKLNISYFTPKIYEGGLIKERSLIKDIAIKIPLDKLNEILRGKILIPDPYGNISSTFQITFETEVINENLKRSYDMRLQKFKSFINFEGAS